MDFAFENEDYFDGRRKESGIKIKSAIMVSHGYDEGYAVEPFEIGYKGGATMLVWNMPESWR